MPTLAPKQTVEEIRATIARVAANDPELTKVDWMQAGTVTDAEVASVAEALVGNTFVQVLILFGNKAVTDVGAAKLAAAIPVCCLWNIDVTGTQVTDGKKAELRRLCVSNAAQLLATNHPGLESLNLGQYSTGCTDADFVALAAGLRGNGVVTAIDFIGNGDITDRSIAAG